MPRKSKILKSSICNNCKKEYKHSIDQKNRKYCGYKCAKQARESKKVHTCEYCKKKFITQTWNNKAKYCSRKCQHIHRHELTFRKVTCKNCRKEFERNLYQLNKTKNTFCSQACSIVYNRGENHYEWKENLHDKNLKLALKQWGIKIKERDSYTCQICSEKDRTILEAHHIKERASFPELQFDLNNGITLCLRCHILQHTNNEKALRLIKYKLIKYENDKKALDTKKP